jgi:hypothetical protein
MAAPHHGQSRTVRENAVVQAEALFDIQKRGRFFSKSFPGTKASDEWQRHREQLQETESTVDASTTNSSVALDWQQTVAGDAAQMELHDAVSRTDRGGAPT